MTPQTRARLQIDPSAVQSNTSTPSPTSALSTQSPLTNRPPSANSETEEEEDSSSSTKSDPEKPKRSRVTPDQLVHLERFFAAERSPPASRRREISDLLGMNERQTQIWFQNRRAKAKLQSSKIKQAKEQDKGRSPYAPPGFSTTFEIELNNLIHEDEPVTFIPCSDLSIGSWRRIATDSSQRDLVAYTCEAKRCLTWFISNAGFGFKMEIPFNTIVDAELTQPSSGSTGLASFVLSRPPVFYLESGSKDNLGRHWKRCTDWTEGHQASQVFRHDLIGSVVPLDHLIQSLHASPEVSPHSPYYRSEPPSPMEIPQPPLASILGSEQQYVGDSNILRASHNRRRSYDTRGLSHLVVTGLSNYGRDLPHTAPAASYTHTSYLPATVYNPLPTTEFIEEEQQSLEDYGALPISHDMTPRPYSAQPVPRGFYEKPSPFFFDAYSNDECRAVDAYPGVAQMYYTPDQGIGFC
ncbi:hypothetical protein C8J57DRAFT_1052956 [Mycena rebaudengoi]|nr:hypothetical protein C8J57DRAFT_1052956 [Mycena rebaudengoi]